VGQYGIMAESNGLYSFYVIFIFCLTGDYRIVPYLLSSLKPVFAELNHDAAEDFLDEGLKIYDNAAERAKILLKETEE
jgi:hypothetical protein